MASCLRSALGPSSTIDPFFVAEDHLRSSSLTAVFLAVVLLDDVQHALLKGRSTQRVWHCACAYALLSRVSNNCRVRVRVRSSRWRSLSAAYMWYSYVRLRFTSKAGVRFLVSPNERGANYSLASHTLCSEGVACETGYCSVWGGEKIATQPKGSLTCLSVYFLES